MKVNRVVFFVSAGLVVVFVVIAAIFAKQTELAFKAIQEFIVSWFGWLYTLSVIGFLVFVIGLLLSPFGSVRLGKDDEGPAYNRLTWFAMLFSAGMGIGLLFFGVAEPMQHFATPPWGETFDATRQAMGVTFYHWGLHVWAIYIVVGLSMAYFAHRRNLPLTLRSSLHPIIGDRIHGPIGDMVDIFAVFGTLFGVATSLGLGAQQINAGLKFLGVLDQSLTNQLILIGGITLVATASVVSGLNVGVRRLSELNLGLAVLLLAFVFFAGPTAHLVESLFHNLAFYPGAIIEMSMTGEAYTGGKWQKSWTLFYWGWWISWTPFVGMFIARISKGRTIREFILGALLAPTALTFLWFTVFGNTALQLELAGQGEIAKAASENAPTALFVMLKELPWSTFSSAFAVVVIGTYFVTSSDSASLVIDIITAGGDPDPPFAQRVFWAITEGVVAAILLMTGGLVALQTAAITTALPICVIMIAMCFGLWKSLREEARGPAQKEGVDQP